MLILSSEHPVVSLSLQALLFGVVPPPRVLAAETQLQNTAFVKTIYTSDFKISSYTVVCFALQDVYDAHNIFIVCKSKDYNLHYIYPKADYIRRDR